MKRIKKWWILRRDNPQLGVYYMGLGQLSKTEARARESTLYGYNSVMPFDSKHDYLAKLAELENTGECVR